MVTELVIGELDELVSRIINGSQDGYCGSVEEYRDELDRVFESSKERITDDLDRSIAYASQKDCEQTKANFRRSTIRVQEKLIDLKAKLESVALDGSEEGFLHVQYDFCHKVYGFIRSLIAVTEEMKEMALTDEEITHTYFAPINYSLERLQSIYQEIVEKNYIDGENTSLGDFLYYFGGTGVKPSRPIRWHKTLGYLTVFVTLMTNDPKYMAKTALNFVVPSKDGVGYSPISLGSLKATKSRKLNDETASYFGTESDIKREIPSLKKA